MIATRSEEYFLGILKELLKLPKEAEWVELKHNNDNPEEIGEYISALSNSAALMGKASAFMVWGMEDETRNIVGTTFKPSTAKKNGTELESWLLFRLNPKIDFVFKELSIEGKPMVVLEMDAATQHPVQFQKTKFIRVGSYKKKLDEFPEKERALWRIFDRVTFEKEIAMEGIGSGDVVRFLDHRAYFDLLSFPVPNDLKGILEAFENERMIVRDSGDKWRITNLGASLFAKQLDAFSHLKRKAVRVIQYDGNSRIKTLREQDGNLGYACGFADLCRSVSEMLPTNEIIKQALRKQVPVFPELAIRELIANAIIHQDFYMTGTSPMIEIFSNRMEITNPGVPLVQTMRFLDNPPKSRNEALASFMRRLGICEERGSGIDKVVFQTELYQLPAPFFEATDEFTRVTLFAHKDLKDMDWENRVRACYLHACLKYVNKDVMTNTTLRERFGIDPKNRAIASRIISDTIKDGLIRPQDKGSGRKYVKYIPFWA
ncbi:MAG TPA: transcriptional regulator [Planctomycetaceae bacterium]|nr:transcriptional regulator [Planctomycetaceae bacterium]